MAHHRRTLFLQPSGLDEHTAQAFLPPTIGIATRAHPSRLFNLNYKPRPSPEHIIQEHFLWAQQL
jgi:hypothetical protein